MNLEKKVVVFGSNSFTGSHFVNHLLENTSAEVIGVSRSPEYNALFLPYLYRKERFQRFSFYQLDLNRDFDTITELLNREKPEVIVNYAAQGEVRNSWKWPEQWIQTNTIAVAKLANFLRDKDYLERYVGISTPEVYGSTEQNIRENHNYDPSTPYAISKLGGDLFLTALHKKEGFPVLLTRSANVYGIHQQLYRIIPRTIIYLKLGKTIDLHGEGRAIRSFIYVGDVTDATLRAIQRGKDGEVYHLSSDEEGVSIRNLVKNICDSMGHDFESSTRPVPENFGQDAMYSLDSSKARRELDWQPSISFEEGIREVIGWIEENWNDIKKQELEYIHKE